MVSRRNIRVKVLQTLYAYTLTHQDNKPLDPIKTLQQNFEKSAELFTFLLYSLVGVAQYAEMDAKNRASKHLPTEEDLNVNTKIAGNEILWKILENESYQKALEICKPKRIAGVDDMIRKTYQKLVISAEYQQYIAQPERDRKNEKQILTYILTELMFSDESFDAYMEEHFSNWDDDVENMHKLIQKFLQKPFEFSVHNLIGKEKWEFASKLTRTVIDKKEQLQNYIRPKLKNWDPERIAALDMLMMEMGVAEFLFFETIPTKVTINEYIDIAKEYSTPQSGQFVNGILDNIHKDLLAANKIQKVDHK